MNNLTAIRPADEPTKLPSRSELLGDHSRKTRSEISLLEDQRRMSVSQRTEMDIKARQLRDELAKTEAAIGTESLRTEAIDKLLRVRRHLLADLESDAA